MRLNVKISVTVLLLVIFAGAAPCFAAVVNGVKFETEHQTGAITLPLRGAGLYRYLVVIKAYAGALYMPEDVTHHDVLTDIPKHLELSYFHPIKGEDFGPATLKTIRLNVEPDTLARIMPKVEEINSLYVDVVPGDRYALTYIPEKGTTLSLNGEPLGTIDGADFAAAMFSPWLGPTPIGEDFKKELLGVQ